MIRKMKNEKFSTQLLPNEVELIRPICDAFLRGHNSPTKKITNDKIVAGLKRAGYDIKNGSGGGATLRKIIGYIRVNDLMNPYFILSDTTGYWVSQDTSEITNFYNSMKFRALAILENIKPLKDRIQ